MNGLCEPRRCAMRALVKLLIASLVAGISIASDAAGRTSSSASRADDRPAVQAQAGGESGLIQQAVIDSVSPAELDPGRPMRVTVTLSLREAATVSRGDLESALRVTVDAIDAAPTSETTLAENAPSLPASTKTQLTLRVNAPPSLQPGRDVAISVYSVVDRRDVATAKAVVRPAALPPSSAASDSARQPFTWQNWTGIAGLAFGLLAIALSLSRHLAMRAEIARKVAEASTEAQAALLAHSDIASPESPQESTKDLPTTVGQAAELPPALFEALQRGDLVLVTGTGIAAHAGLPTSRRLWAQLLDELAGTDIDSATIERVKELVSRGSPESAAEAVVSFLGRDRVMAGLQSKLVDGRAPSPLHRLLVRLPFNAIIDLTWDNLMQRALAERSGVASALRVVTPHSHERMAQLLREGQQTLLKPLGYLGAPEGVAITHLEYRLALSRAPEFDRSLAAMFGTRTLLFMGFSLDRLEQFLAGLPPSLGSSERRHFALMPANAGMVDLWESGIGRRFGVQMLPFTPSPDWRELSAAAESLMASVKAAAQDANAPQFQPAASATRLQHVHLKSIGLFRDLRVDFEPGWTVLLGSNGGGKSTILRAVVLALAGERDHRSQSAASRLLRNGEQKGSIELGIGGATMTCTLDRDNTKVRFQSPQTTLLEAGQLLVLGFPALRGVSMASMRGPTSAPAANPSADDVAPLLLGTVDGRMDNLQQWVVNTALRSEVAPKGREAQMLNTFQQVLSDIVPGGGLSYKRVDRTTWHVILTDRDGETRFDSVSQGMSAILNWVGVLLQRLYDVYPKSRKPESEAAIVLVDEIDAHLHPDWQRRLVSLCRKHFENVQFIVSTHSPMLAGSVAARELRVVERDEVSGQVTCRQPSVDMSGQKAEDILVSPLFSLESTRSIEAELIIKEYVALFERFELEPEEQARMEVLEMRVNELNHGGTVDQRQQLEVIRERVRKKMAEMGAELTTGEAP